MSVGAEGGGVGGHSRRAEIISVEMSCLKMSNFGRE